MFMKPGPANSIVATPGRLSSLGISAEAISRGFFFARLDAIKHRLVVQWPFCKESVRVSLCFLSNVFF